VADAGEEEDVVRTYVFAIVFLRLVIAGVGIVALWCNSMPDDAGDRIVSTLFLLWYGGDAIDDARRGGRC